MNGYTIHNYMIRIVNIEDFLAPAENIRVRAVDPLSAARMASEVYDEELRGEYVGEPTYLRSEDYVYIFMTEEGYFLEVFDCSCKKIERRE